MDSNVISLSDFREKKSQRVELINLASTFSDALAIEEQISPEEYLHEIATRVKERIFKKIPEYRFLIEDGLWEDREDEENESYIVRVRMKGTDIAGHGRNVSSAWIMLSAKLTVEGML